MNEEPKLSIDRHGNRYWNLPNGDLHRTDGPAIETPYGQREWFFHGRLHRNNGPAIEYQSGNKEWYLHGEKHCYENWLAKRKKYIMKFINTSKEQTKPTIFIL